MYYPICPLQLAFFFFFNATATTEIYTLSLHDALPIFLLLGQGGELDLVLHDLPLHLVDLLREGIDLDARSEEHTSELQSHVNLVCRLLLEKKKQEHVTSTRFPHCPSTKRSRRRRRARQ